MKKTINKEHIEGRVYEHDLAIKKVQNESSKNFGKEFISGTLDIATDEDCMNIVTIHYTYVTETTAAGKKNNTYTALKSIIDSGKTVVTDGKDNATKVKADTSIALNDFYSDKAKSDVNPEGLVSSKRNEGGFVNIVTALNEDENARNTFELDMLLNGTRFVEADEEKKLPEYLLLKGVAFNFRNDILPMELPIRDPKGIQYFQNLGIAKDNMVFTKVWGHVVSNQTKVTKTEEAAFGEDKVVEYTRTHKEWLVENTLKVPYELGDAETGITVEELQKAVENRNVYLADVKKRQDEYQASKAAAPAAQAGVSAAMGGFNF